MKQWLDNHPLTTVLLTIGLIAGAVILVLWLMPIVVEFIFDLFRVQI